MYHHVQDINEQCFEIFEINNIDYIDIYTDIYTNTYIDIYIHIYIM